MSIFSEMALEARNDSRTKTKPDHPLRQEPQASIPAKPQAAEQPEPEQAEQAPASKPVPQVASQEPPSDDAARQAHEAAEAKRKAEWETKQSARKATEQTQLARLAAMSDQEAALLSAQRVSADTERLTRRNMKDCVSDHIQSLCRENPDFARRVLHPRKTMVNCFKYICRKAQEFAKREMEDLGKSEVNGVYGIDVPDSLCFQWAEGYFNDPDAPEDQEKDDKFTPRPYSGKAKTTASKAPEKKPAKSKAAIDGQISLLGEAG